MAANAIAQRNSTSFLKKRPIGAGYRREGPDRFAVRPVAGRSAPHGLRAPSASPASPSVRLPDVTFCEQVAGWAVSLSADRPPASVLERARIQSAAVLAAAEAGEEAAAPLAVAAPDGPLGEVWRGASAAIAPDWDDYLYLGHAGHSAVWAARAFASDPDSERTLTAQVAA